MSLLVLCVPIFVYVSKKNAQFNLFFQVIQYFACWRLLIRLTCMKC